MDHEALATLYRASEAHKREVMDVIFAEVQRGSGPHFRVTFEAITIELILLHPRQAPMFAKVAEVLADLTERGALTKTASNAYVPAEELRTWLVQRRTAVRDRA